MPTNMLSKEDVSKLVYSYQNDAVTDELYEFGAMLMVEIQNRADKINSQSAIVLGWATAVLALLLTQSDRFRGGVAYFALASGLSAVLAVLAAFLAVRTRGNWSWPSDTSWIKESALNSRDELRRYHIRVMHDVRRGHLRITTSKARYLFCSEMCLVIGAFALFAAISYQLLLGKFPWIFASAKGVQVRVIVARWMGVWGF